MKKYIQEKQKKKQNNKNVIPIKQRNPVTKKSIVIETVTSRKTVCTPIKSVELFYTINIRNF